MLKIQQSTTIYGRENKLAYFAGITFDAVQEERGGYTFIVSEGRHKINQCYAKNRYLRYYFAGMEDLKKIEWGEKEITFTFVKRDGYKYNSCMFVWSPKFAWEEKNGAEFIEFMKQFGVEVINKTK